LQRLCRATLEVQMLAHPQRTEQARWS
jgi:hypothetical protein